MSLSAMIFIKLCFLLFIIKIYIFKLGIRCLSRSCPLSHPCSADGVLLSLAMETRIIRKKLFQISHFRKCSSRCNFSRLHADTYRCNHSHLRKNSYRMDQHGSICPHNIPCLLTVKGSEE